MLVFLPFELQSLFWAIFSEPSTDVSPPNMS